METASVLSSCEYSLLSKVKEQEIHILLATHEETNCRRVSYENEISKSNTSARGIGAKVISKSLAHKSLLEQMAGTFFVIYSYSSVLPRIPSRALSISLPFSFPLFFHLQTRTPLTRMDDRRISRIARSSLEHQIYV